MPIVNGEYVPEGIPAQTLAGIAAGGGIMQTSAGGVDVSDAIYRALPVGGGVGFDPNRGFDPALIRAAGANPLALIGAAGGLAGLIRAVPTIANLIRGIPGGGLAGIGAAAGGLYGLAQGLGLGEGGGLFGLNLLGGDDFVMGGVEMGGPGLAEPKAPYREWRIGNKQFYAIRPIRKGSGTKIIMYDRESKRWRYWTLKSNNAIIGKNMPSHRMLTRLRRNLSKQSADAKTILKITSPKSLRQTRRGRR